MATSEKAKKRQVQHNRKAELKKVEQDIVQLLVEEERDEPLPDEIPSHRKTTPQESLEKSRSSFLKLLEPPTDSVKRKRWFIRRMLLLSIVILVAIAAILIGVDKPVIAAILLVIGLVGQVFSGLLALLGLIPVIGPLLVGALSLPFIWLMNALGYVVSMKMVAEGKGREVLNWRTVAMVFVTGIAIGIVIGRLLPGK
ncbi:MAG: DUF4112 domain-containing protein [bacterium]|nr:DUF4112 domain-containing protein [bacterium]